MTKYCRKCQKTKRCSKCGKAKPATEFNRSKNKPDGLQSYCKLCHRQSVYEYQQQPHVQRRRRLYFREYEKRPQVRRQRNAYHLDYDRRPAMRLRKHDYRRQLRHAQIKRYGGQCLLCGDSNIQRLTIDHVHGDGKQQRQELRGNNLTFYRWLATQPLLPRRFRVLCHRCNNCKRAHIPDYKVRLKRLQETLNQFLSRRAWKKFCLQCDGIKPLGEFHKSRCNKDGHSVYCKDCIQQQHQESKHRTKRKAA